MKSISSKTRGHLKTLQRMFMAWSQFKSNQLPNKSTVLKTSPWISKKISTIILWTVRHLQKPRAICLLWRMSKIQRFLRKNKSKSHHRSSNRLLQSRNSRFLNSPCKSQILYLLPILSIHHSAPKAQEVIDSLSPQHRLTIRRLQRPSPPWRIRKIKSLL